MPARSWIEVECQRQRVGPLPAGGELRLKILVADGVGRLADVGELEENLIGDVAPGGDFRYGWEQDVGLTRRRDDEGPAVLTIAGAAGLTSAERDDEQRDTDTRGIQPCGLHGGPIRLKGD